MFGGNDVDSVVGTRLVACPPFFSPELPEVVSDVFADITTEDDDDEGA